MKRVLFIGNRCSCYKVLERNPKYKIVKTFALADSYLERYLKAQGTAFETFTTKDKQQVISQLKDLQYDILVSNGCPMILPASELQAQGKLLLNTHPTYLPHLRGFTPLNGVFYNDYKFIGATTHYMNDAIDAGNIIAQVKVELTDDIDQGLVYFLSFDIEGEAFAKALELLEESDYLFEGTPMDISQGSCFNRTKDKQTIDFGSETTAQIIRKVKSFGIKGQGCNTRIEDRQYTIYDAQPIVNEYLRQKFASVETGRIAHVYDEKMIVRTIDGLIKITRFSC